MFTYLGQHWTGYKDSSDQFIDFNIQLAILAGKLLSPNVRTVQDIFFLSRLSLVLCWGKSPTSRVLERSLIEEDPSRKVKVVLPDNVELERAAKKFKTAVDMAGPNLTLGCAAVKKGLMWVLGAGEELKDDSPADIYIAVNASTIELPSIRKYAADIVKDKVLILWCLELDTLRADLGLFGFPGKEARVYSHEGAIRIEFRVSVWRTMADHRLQQMAARARHAH
eukprot:6252695-Pyramimonas_sp.AAC.1